ncbi:PDZ domain-containing protein [Fulvivirga sp. M361]|uniref:S41 family peptidase n=1 Tax=Fulvivirga sp. M361 TaxID=2594266 RepID=UPI001179F508|nr:S41 family peptidase [Fulvivirga sp. M361]TRX62522.1 PDZ domain-containing protein [Fulvivirga sp. M361]
MKSRLIRTIGFVFLASIVLSFISPTERYFEIAKNLDIFATLFKEVNAYYVDEIEPDKLIRVGIDAMLGSLDPYTNFIPEEEIESFRTLTTGQYAGIGALIGNINGKIVVTMPYEKFAAHKAGIKIGDELISIDNVDVKGKSVTQISALLKGQAKTKVKIIARRYGEADPITFEFNREKITIGNVSYAGMIDDQIGYIKLHDFTPGAGKEVAEALKKLKNENAGSVVLDLRDNPGGLLSEAVNVSNVFISKNKEVVSTKGKVVEWNKTYKTLNNPVDTEIPLVVLISGGSASAAEIVSGVIQDYDRGVLIGSRTFGKGLVQTTRPLTYNSQLKVTTAKYYIPSGRCIQALDYAHRNEDGSVDRVPDSLKVEFKTKRGRSVYDGGGLDPDLVVKRDYIAPITISLISKGHIFNFSTKFYYENKERIKTPGFELSEEDYQGFKDWLQDKEYDYTTTVEKTLESLESSAKKEKYFDDINQQLMDLKNKVVHNKDSDLENFKTEILQVLREEVLSRAFLEKGGIKASFDSDDDISKSMAVLMDEARYNQVLSKK